MPYRDDRDALRERIEWLAQELDRARAEDRVPALALELTDARERLARLERTPADGVRRRVRVLASVLAGALASLGVTLGVIAYLEARDEPGASAPLPPYSPEPEPPLKLEVDSPPGWASTTDERWTELTSPDDKARIRFTYAGGAANASSARADVWKVLCPSAEFERMQSREIGPDHLPAVYYEGPCTSEGAILVVVDVQSYHFEVDATGLVNTAEATSLGNHVVLASRLARDCPESRRIELASMIASIRRRR